MNAYTMRFNGGLLARGFWIYVWRITHGERDAFYMRRTGDSSSPISVISVSSD